MVNKSKHLKELQRRLGVKLNLENWKQFSLLNLTLLALDNLIIKF